MSASVIEAVTISVRWAQSMEPARSAFDQTSSAFRGLPPVSKHSNQRSSNGKATVAYIATIA